jgi:hypothetical protein
MIFMNEICEKYDKQDQQSKAALNERNPQKTQRQEPVARSLDKPLLVTLNYFISSAC